MTDEAERCAEAELETDPALPEPDETPASAEVPEEPEETEELRQLRRGLKKTGVFLILLAVVFVAAFTAYIVGTIRLAKERERAYHFVGFSPAGDGEFTLTADARALGTDSLLLASYNSRTYYNALCDADQQVYRAFETALENGWEEVYLDDTLISSCRHTPTEILVLLALDSPFLEQNIHTIEGHRFSRYVPKGEIAPFGMMVSGIRVDVDNFSPARLAKKKEALTKAKEIAAALTGKTDREKADAVYRYLVEHVSYEGERTFDRSDYLYDALCRGETNCDGFTNSFSLLSSLLGLKSFEKSYYVEEGAIGHTWNCVQIENVWYNVDATFAQGYLAGNRGRADEDKMILVRFSTFGFPDSRQKQPHGFEELTPVCEEDLTAPDLVLESSTAVPCVDAVSAVLERSEKPYVLIVSNFMLRETDLQEIANRVGALHASSFGPSDKEIYYVLRLK